MSKTEIRAIRDDRERKLVFGQRYDVYCRQKKWEPANPRHRETDEHDPRSMLFAAFEDGKIIGSVRLIHQGPFPIEGQFPFPSRDDMGVDERQRVCAGEVSRLIVSPRNRCPRFTVSLGLLQVLIRYSAQAELTHWMQALIVPSYRLIRLYGFPLHRFAPSAKHRGGPIVVPTVINIENTFDRFAKERPQVFNFFSQDIRPKDVIREAEKALH